VTERTEVLRDTATLFSQAPEPDVGVDPGKRTEVCVVRHGIFPSRGRHWQSGGALPAAARTMRGSRGESDRRFVLGALSAPMSRQVMPMIPSTRLI
jgi:hypothetical protein